MTSSATLLHPPVPSNAEASTVALEQSSADGYASLTQSQLALHDGALDVLQIRRERLLRLGRLDLCGRSEHVEIEQVSAERERSVRLENCRASPGERRTGSCCPTARVVICLKLHI